MGGQNPYIEETKFVPATKKYKVTFIKNGEPVRLKPSEKNHGNITPSLRHEDKNTKKQVLNHGGVTPVSTSSSPHSSVRS